MKDAEIIVVARRLLNGSGSGSTASFSSSPVSPLNASAARSIGSATPIFATSDQLVERQNLTMRMSMRRVTRGWLMGIKPPLSFL